MTMGTRAGVGPGKKVALLLGVFLLAGCGDKAALPAGCYYADDGTALLKLMDGRAHVLIPGEVKDLKLQWYGDYVEVTPAFYLLDPPLRTERNTALERVQMPIAVKPLPTIQVLYAPAGHLAAVLGKPC
jgi:hypothetical protein